MNTIKTLLKAVFYETSEGRFTLKNMFNLILTIIILCLFIFVSVTRTGANISFRVMLPYAQRIISGYLMMLTIALFSFVVSLTIGTLAAIGKQSKLLFIKYLCIIYIEFIRGTPLITQIYLFFYLVGTAWGINDRLIAGIFVLSIFEGAYIAEIIRGSYISIDKTQLESAKAVGFNRLQTLRYVILPQLIARTLPALTGQFSSIVKDSSLLSVIAITELFQSVKEISATNFRLFEAMLLLGILYLTVTLPLSYVSNRLERKFNYEN